LGVDGFALDFRASVIVESFSTWLRFADVLVNEYASPPYVTLIAFVPVARVVVERVATPPASVPDPIAADPLLKVTLPVGNAPVEVTNALNVTDWP
jgi:hypothetical protein